MSDLLIKNMELPKGNDYLHLIIQNGKVHTVISCGHLTTDKLNVADAIEIKPHGRLIDADTLADDFYVQLVVTSPYMQKSVTDQMVENVRLASQMAPTVLEANND